MNAWTVEKVERLIVLNRGRALCPDSVVRINLEVSAKECAVEYVRRINAAGEVCAAIIFAPRNKKLRFAVYPKTLELPKPQWSVRCVTREEALAAVQQERIQHPARYVRGVEAEGGGFVIESWEPWDFLRQGLYPCWNVEEIIGGHREYGFKGADREIKLIERAEGMTEKKQATKEKRADKIISEYEKQRAKHGNEVPKWFLLEEIMKGHPRKKGYSLRTLKSVLKGFK